MAANTVPLSVEAMAVLDTIWCKLFCAMDKGFDVRNVSRGLSGGADFEAEKSLSTLL
jgi:hypothetical protein